MAASDGDDAVLAALNKLVLLSRAVVDPAITKKADHDTLSSFAILRFGSSLRSSPTIGGAKGARSLCTAEEGLGRPLSQQSCAYPRGALLTGSLPQSFHGLYRM